MFLEDGHQPGRIGSRATRSRRLDFLKEHVDAARDSGGYGPARCVADVLKRVGTAAGRKHGVAGASVYLLPVHLEPELTLKDIPPLVLAFMTVKRRTLKRLRTPFEDSECAACIGASNLDGDFRTQYGYAFAGAALAHESWPGVVGDS